MTDKEKCTYWQKLEVKEHLLVGCMLLISVFVNTKNMITRIFR